LSPIEVETVSADHEPRKLAYRIDEAVRATGLGRSFLYERIADGTLKSFKIGGRRLIAHSDLESFLAEARACMLKWAT
jgi:excisionase family DNA binding protein